MPAMKSAMWRLRSGSSASQPVARRARAITSASDTVRLRLSGAGGHTSRPHLTNDVVYLSAMEEAKHFVAQANAELDKAGRFKDEFVICRHAGEVMMAPRENVDLMDVSPKQMVSVAAALIPFLENDDANRALMGSNMQRQAVPLVKAEAPFVGTGMEAIVARDSGAAIMARRGGIIDQVDAQRIVVRATEDMGAGDAGVDIYRLRKFKRSNQSSTINQRPLVKVGEKVVKDQVIADGPSTDLGDLALGRNALVANYGGGSVACLPINADGTLKGEDGIRAALDEAGAVADEAREARGEARARQLPTGVARMRRPTGIGRDRFYRAAVDVGRRGPSPQVPDRFLRCEPYTRRPSRRHPSG